MLICLDLMSGAERWQTPVPGDLISAPVVNGSSVYFTTFDGHVRRHRLQDGQPIWSGRKRATFAPWIWNRRAYVTMREAGAKRGPSGDQPIEGCAALSNAKGDPEQERLWSRREALHLSASAQARTRHAPEQAADDSSVGFGGGAPAVARIHAAAANAGRSTVRGRWEFQGVADDRDGRSGVHCNGEHTAVPEPNDRESALGDDHGLPGKAGWLASDTPSIAGAERTWGRRAPSPTATTPLVASCCGSTASGSPSASSPPSLAAAST